MYSKSLSGVYRHGNSGLERRHDNISAQDSGPRENPHYRSYYFLQEGYNKLLGRKSHFEAEGPLRVTEFSPYELNTDMRWRGLEPPAITHLAFEPHWNTLLRPVDVHQKEKRTPKKDVLELGTIEQTEDWWKHLKLLIDKHYLGVGDIGPRESRNIQKVHEFFVHFEDAITHHDYQDKGLLNTLVATRPKELDDIYAVFLEMEANTVDFNHCPRCSLPYESTEFCGEGEYNSPYRQYRGRYGPHKQWGKEWFDSIARRAEQLWYKATEHPIWGAEFHTQRQVEALMNVYCKTMQRGKAISFMTKLRGSEEFITGKVTVTPEMEKAYNALLDSTPHPHILTNAHKQDPRVAKFMKSEEAMPVSPHQLRVDMEVDRFRRMQKEEGVVRVPPQGWQIDMKDVAHYKFDSRGYVSNWRKVKESLERSFLSTGLDHAKDAFTAWEKVQKEFLEDRIKVAKPRALALEAELERDRKALGANGFVFPDAEYYRVFDRSESALKPFNVFHGASVTAQLRVPINPAQVPCTVGRQTFTFDIRDEVTRYFGLSSGDVVNLTSRADKDVLNVVVAGVAARDGTQTLYGFNTADKEDVVTIGTSVRDVRKRFTSVDVVGREALFGEYIAQTAMTTEHFSGVVVGVRNGVLYCQWGSDVATPLGGAAFVKEHWNLSVSNEPRKPKEPFSWDTPFRNSQDEAELERIKQAPWKREAWAPLIPGKYTPKVKRFGYTQHIEQDDFKTKEYKDRVQSKQFYHSPQSFQVLPDRTENSVNFGRKTEYQRLQGLPGVDRRELDEGWGPTPEVPEWEVAAVEQALSDISGRRPGNFVKRQSEIGSLKVPEPWFEEMNPHWEHHNRQESVLHPTERRATDPATVPFSGRAPVLGQSLGMYERVKGVMDDWSKGFDLGPSGHAPQADHGKYNTLNVQAVRSDRLGHHNVLLQMFEARLTKLGWSEEDFVLQHAHASANPKELLLALRAWSTRARPPPPVLKAALADFLSTDIAEYNEGVPENVAKLSCDCLDDVVITPATQPVVWADYDPAHFQQRKEDGGMRVAVGDEGFLVSSYVTYAMRDHASSDAVLDGWIQQSLINNFYDALRRISGLDVPVAQSDNRSEFARTFANKSVCGSHLREMLVSLGFSHERLQALFAPNSIPSLAFREVTVNGRADFVVGVDKLLKWEGQSSQKAQGKQAQSSTSENKVSSVLGEGDGTQSKAVQGVPAPDLLATMIQHDDGFALDVLYGVRENARSNPGLKNVFEQLVRFFEPDATQWDGLFDRYCRGEWVPAADAVRAAIPKFVAENPACLVFDTKGSIVDIQPPEPSQTAFEFENVRADALQTIMHFRKWGIREGFEWQPVVPVLHPGSKSAGFQFNPALTRNQKPLMNGCHFGQASNEGNILEDFGLANAFAAAKIPNSERLVAENSLLVRFVNRVLYRHFPLLVHWGVAFPKTAAERAAARETSTRESRTRLQRIKQQTNDESSKSKEIFTRSSERYWRRIIEEGEKGSSSAAVSSGSGGHRAKPGRVSGSTQYKTDGPRDDDVARAAKEGVPGKATMKRAGQFHQKGGRQGNQGSTFQQGSSQHASRQSEFGATVSDGRGGGSGGRARGGRGRGGRGGSQ